MNKLITAAVVSLTLFATACGDSESSDTTEAPAASDADAAPDDTEAASDETSAASSGGSLQEQVAEQTIELASSAGVTVDEDCIREATAQLSDEDAQMIVDSYTSGQDVTVSPEGEAIGEAMGVECLLAGS